MKGLTSGSLTWLLAKEIYHFALPSNQKKTHFSHFHVGLPQYDAGGWPKVSQLLLLG